MKKAVVLLSGGLDSTTALYWAKAKGYQCHCLIFDYGQRHRREIESAKKIAQKAGVSFDVIAIKLGWTGRSALLDLDVKLPNIPLEKIGQGPIPSTYVPGRNTLFTAYAISAADALGAEAIVLGPNVLDYSGYPDCRPEYYQAFRRVARLGTKRGVEGKSLKILTPLIKMTKAQIVKLGAQLGVPWELTWSCYAGGARPCGQCDSCKLRAKGFEKAKIQDLIYA
ncbi:MAG: 7-cyano-7-deazaguanine synthase QueC [Elusimicrobia bacterium]|nr:7-cyano-7-deazaguanine synthase QueC [Elusimicrobiota bacterium]